LFCRVIEKREEHQRNVQIYTIPETVPTELLQSTYLNLKNKIVAPKSKSNDPKCIKHIKSMVNLGAASHRIVGHAREPALCHGHNPYNCAIPNCRDGADQRDTGY